MEKWFLKESEEMLIDLEARDKIQQEAVFLEKKGYKKIEDEYSINYALSNLFISVVFPPNSEESDVLIRFLDINQVFSIGWIALVRNNIKGTSKKVENVIELVKYVKEYYDNITDYQFCLQSNILIDDYVEQHRIQFEKCVADFLENS